jgi:hypothetical protein
MNYNIFAFYYVVIIIEIMPDEEVFFNYLKKAAGLPPFVNFKKHQVVKITFL